MQRHGVVVVEMNRDWECTACVKKWSVKIKVEEGERNMVSGGVKVAKCRDSGDP